MAARKEKMVEMMTGVVDDHLKLLGERRAVRQRVAGDGKGVDIGIAPGGFHSSLERHLMTLTPATRERLLAHVREHVAEAMKPLRKLIAAKGDDVELRLFDDVGPNCLRTIIEFLEEKNSD